MTDNDTYLTCRVIALENCQRDAEEGLKALERARFYLDDSTPSEAFAALEDVYRSLTSITWR